MRNTASLEASIEIGQTVGSYRVLRKIGQGGMASVYEGVHLQIQRRAAIKVLRPSLSEDDELTARFMNEARAVSIVRHPGVVSALEVGRLPSGSAYMIMELLEGETLGDRLERSGDGMEAPAAMRIIRQIASAVRAAHKQGIVHRDLKPDNVMIVADSEMPGGERIKVLDFGIAKVRALLDDPAGRPVETQSGAFLGTPMYMAPEQCRGADRVTDRADVYSLGVIFFEILVGRPPFEGSNNLELLSQQLSAPPPDLRALQPSVPLELAQLVATMLAKEPLHRPAMDGVIATLDRLLDDPATETGAGGVPALAVPGPSAWGRQRAARRPFVLGAVAVLAAALALGASLWRRDPGPPPRPTVTERPAPASVAEAAPVAADLGIAAAAPPRSPASQRAPGDRRLRRAAPRPQLAAKKPPEERDITDADVPFLP